MLARFLILAALLARAAANEAAANDDKTAAASDDKTAAGSGDKTAAGSGDKTANDGKKEETSKECKAQAATAKTMIAEYKAEIAVNPNNKCDAFDRLMSGKGALNAAAKTFDQVLAGCTKTSEGEAVIKEKDSILTNLCAGSCNQGGTQATELIQFCPTTTLTPWDSSESSSADQDSLESSYTGFFQKDSSDDSSNSGTSSGSTASGSSGSYMQLWQWIAVLSLLTCCCCGCIAAALSSKPKPKKKKKPVAPPAPVPVAEPEEPMPELSPLMMDQPITTSFAMPMAQPMMTPSYPMTTSYAPTTYMPAYSGYSPGVIV